MSSERSEYLKSHLDRGDLAADPISQLQRWLEDARKRNVFEPEAMCLATASAEGRPSARMVLLRGLSEEGLTFFTNYESRKGGELEANPWASVCFYWPQMERQVRFEGLVRRVSEAESNAYFDARPLESRRASAVSPQSRMIESRESLERLVANVDESVTRPDHWGGYLLLPDRAEFWQGRAARLHDRFEFRRDESGWEIVRLAP